VRVSEPSPYATCSIGGRGATYVDSVVEPATAVNPRTANSSHVNIIGIWQQDRMRLGRARGAAVAYSFDGGHTWKETTLPWSRCASRGLRYNSITDPWISFGTNDTAYAIAAESTLPTSSGRAPTAPITAIVVSTSKNGGRSWPTTRTLMASHEFDDKPSVTADPTRPNVAYAIWQESALGAPATLFARTSDGGATWSTPQPIMSRSGGATASGNIIVVDRKGRLYDVFDLVHPSSKPRTICGSKRGRVRCVPFPVGQQPAAAPFFVSDIAVMRSSNGGQSWSSPTAIAADLGSEVTAPTGPGLRTGVNLPTVAINESTGRLYVAWQDTRFTAGQTDQIVLASSRDGVRWSTPVVVSGSSGGAAFDPNLAVNATGRVGLTYYELRAPTHDKSFQTDFWFRSASDGIHFGTPRHIAGPFDMRAAPLSGGYFVGDYVGLATAGRTFHSLFVMAGVEHGKKATNAFEATIAP
jgi:hypothetical protein